MSNEYDEYLRVHKTMVYECAQWMFNNLVTVNDCDDEARFLFLQNAANHDESKYSAEEYYAYDEYFYGTKDENEFNKAWLHHIHHNPHHWQYWILFEDDPGQNREKAIEMPVEYALEMVADWWSFSWKEQKLDEVLKWYDNHKNKIILHPKTRALVESILNEIKETLEE